MPTDKEIEAARSTVVHNCLIVDLVLDEEIIAILDAAEKVRAEAATKREEKLRLALEFYADEDNFLAVPSTPIYAEDCVITCHYWWVYSTGNPTDTAKQALQQTEDK